MICVSNACRQHSGRCPTPWTCGGYATEAHHAAMTKQLGGGNYLPREQAMSVEMYEPAPRLLKRLGLVALLIFAFLAAWAAAVYFPAWPRLVAALAF